MTSELIERLEKATGPDRELDACIFLLQWPGYRLQTDCEPFPDQVEPGRIQEIGGFAHRTAPAFTASIDAALTLVPEGMRRRTVVMEDGKSGVQLWWPDEDMPGAWGHAYASEPIATVIAALRAKEPLP
jgi:hypothetical protein